MGVGKTTIGKALAEKFNYAFYDTDDEQHWDRLGFSRDELFSNDREKFHEVESGILKFILRDKKNSVISTGGSIVLREENIDLMKSSGTIIFLNADAKNIINRINNSDDIKKSVMKGSSLEDTENFMNERGPKYRFANLEIDTSDKSIKEVCYNIELYLDLYKNNVDIGVLKENNVYLMGGSILRLFMDLPLDTDLDFYFVDYESYKNVDDYFRKNFKFQNKSDSWRNYKCNDLVVQLIWNKDAEWGKGSYDDVVATFDFTITTGGFGFKDEIFRYSKTYFDDIENKRLIPNYWPFEDSNNHTSVELLYRIEKFKKLGFKIESNLLDKIRNKSKVTNELNQRIIRDSWLRDKTVYPIVPNIDVFVNWLMDIKDHPNLEKFNVYLWGGFISRPHETKDIDVLITKRNGQYATLKELEELMVDMFDSAYDTHGFFIDTCYMRIPQWIGDYPRNKEFLKSVERKQLFITITKNEDKDMECKHRRYGLLNCAYTGSFTLRGVEPSSLVHRWVDLDANYAKMVDLRRIIKYYENDKKRNIEDFLNKFQEYSGY